VDTRRAPQGIVRAHLPDEHPELAAGLRPPFARSRPPAPIDPEPLTMPAHYGLQVHDSDRLSDPRPEAKGQSEYEAIGPRQSDDGEQDFQARVQRAISGSRQADRAAIGVSGS
jgi:hypothetical protein